MSFLSELYTWIKGKMTEKYKQRLIQLAKDIKQVREGLHINKYDLLQQKINHLIGYILSLEELEEK